MIIETSYYFSQCMEKASVVGRLKYGQNLALVPTGLRF